MARVPELLRRARVGLSRFITAPARPSETAPWWDAGGGPATLAFWLALAVQTGALFRQKFLPFLDYPQHLAMGAVLHRLMRSGAPERLVYDTNLWSFNSLFHVLVAYLAGVLPIERAGEAAMGVIFVLFAVGTLQLLKATGRPRCRALLLLPLLSTFPIVWGLCNFLLSFALQLLVLARVITTPKVAPERRVRFDVVTALLAGLGMWAHLLASMLGYALVLVAIVVDAETLEAPFARRLARAFRTGLPLLPALVYLRWSYHAQPGMSDYVFMDDLDDAYGWEKLRHFYEHLGGARSDKLDEHFSLWATLALVASGLSRVRAGRAPPVTRWLLPAATLLYFVLPMTMWGGTWGIYPRVALAMGIAFLVFVPHATGPRRAFTAIFAALALGSAATFFQTMGLASAEMDDFDRLLDDAPPNRHVLGLMLEGYLPGTWAKVVTHFPAYYVARKGGQAAVSFFGVLSLPAHYKPDKAPPATSNALEWNPDHYDSHADYAGYFDLLIVHTADPWWDPRPQIFGGSVEDAGRIRSHHGRWWLIEARKGR